MRPSVLIAIVVAVLVAWPRPALADLTADELVLITNRNVPESRQLAEYYSQARGVPGGRIIELDLPATDQLSRKAYEQTVVPQVRQFIIDADLREKVRCAVTFYGVPLIVEARELTPVERRERAHVNEEADSLVRRLGPAVRDAEQLLKEVGFKPSPVRADEADRLDVLLSRLATAESFVSRLSPAQLPPGKREEFAAKVAGIRKRLDAPFEPDGAPFNAEAYAAVSRRPDAQGRRLAREMLRARAPLPKYGELLLQHQRILSEEQSHAAFDSELATLWLDNAPAASWLPNPLARAGRQEEDGTPVVLMVSRLDGRDPQQVRDLIATSMEVEREGLSGKFVIDSRGIPAERPGGAADGYGVFDEQLRRLSAYLAEHGRLELVHDEKAEVIQPPGPTEVAVYVGWYSLTKYVRAMQFRPGAVGFHVASFEMRSLRDPAKPGWVRGLLDDGVVGTVGPVAEPFLAAFPPPEQFFPLLLTGELTLAEVYWRTTPLLSWQLGLIGDPLYRPFAAAPALDPEKLPPPLRLGIER